MGTFPCWGAYGLSPNLWFRDAARPMFSPSIETAHTKSKTPPLPTTIQIRYPENMPFSVRAKHLRGWIIWRKTRSDKVVTDFPFFSSIPGQANGPRGWWETTNPRPHQRSGQLGQFGYLGFRKFRKTSKLTRIKRDLPPWNGPLSGMRAIALYLF